MRCFPYVSKLTLSSQSGSLFDREKDNCTCRPRSVQIDFSDPAYAPFAHLGADATQAGLDRDVLQLRELGFDAELVLTVNDPAVASVDIIKALQAKAWDCVLIGAGVRTIVKNFLLFEVLVNLVHEHAPQAKICFNTKPDDSAAAVERWMAP